MFSNITEAWDNNPVREITNKLSKGDFNTYKSDQLKKPDFLTDTKNKITKKNNKKINDKNSKNSKNSKKYKFLSTDSDLISLTGDNIHLLSGTDTSSGSDFKIDLSSNLNSNLNSNLSSDYGGFAPVNFNKYIKQNKPSKISLSSVLNSDSDNFLDHKYNSKCEFSVKHLRKCNRCYDNLKKIIDDKLNKKIDEYILENKLKQIQTLVPPTNKQDSMIESFGNKNSDQWKIITIVIISIIVIIIILFFMMKILNK
ncbi:hypothetical protein QLL95_gp1030 [Cotonvirus japonicus]|uniref:Uncharacterized protein n=1 Tax=Cotonvirus japonicus TaxID=2811091 RepID=A0ABM7NSG2_9VIRU|nr:hypothetical protein QLL95_gp1030 [Cotonvirus japonicus]BCS83093.1 hypothetical protein [Cotonvirus japonicus]